MSDLAPAPAPAPLPASASATSSRRYTHLTPSEADHFLTHGWLRIPNAIAPEYLSWTDNVFTRLGIDPHDKATWTDEYVKLPRHREVRAELFCPEAWPKLMDIVGGEERVDPVRERWFGDQFIINFGSEKWTREEHTMRDLKGWHTDNDW
jgi:hypothetical protein